uniref:Uncharacterized protein n=1 Tax=Pseudomonas phage BL5 TaxID=3109218 RepID=A0AAU7B8L2_9VIRU
MGGLAKGGRKTETASAVLDHGPSLAWSGGRAI